MPDTQEQHRMVLTTAQMAALKAICEADTIPATQRFIVVVQTVFGWSLVAQAETIQPTNHAIPTEQWQEICGWFTTLGGPTSDAVHYGLTWMDRGPSAYNE